MRSETQTQTQAPSRPARPIREIWLVAAPANSRRWVQWAVVLPPHHTRAGSHFSSSSPRSQLAIAVDACLTPLTLLLLSQSTHHVANNNAHQPTPNAPRRHTACSTSSSTSVSGSTPLHDPLRLSLLPPSPATTFAHPLTSRLPA